MRRQDFLHAIAGSITGGWPLDALAQQPAVPVIGVLGSETEFDKIFIGGLRQGLNDSGYVEGQNITIEYRWAEGVYDRLPALAAELVRRQVAVLVASSTPALAAAKTATVTIPIVFNTGADPVVAGFVTSLNRPGGNLTGITILLTQVVPKQFELLREAIPKAGSIGFLHNPTNRTFAQSIIAGAQTAAGKLGFKLQVLEASTERGLDDAFATSAQLRLDGLVIGPDQFFTDRSEQLGALTTRYALPAIYHYRGFAAAGGLMSYGANLPEAYRLEGTYVGRILKGEKPGDLPVQQSTKVDLIVNLKTAKALGLSLPLPLLGRADEVIE
jgi:putative tryptophan/tyrosine transport system substrate-binding protein